MATVSVRHKYQQANISFAEVNNLPEGNRTSLKKGTVTARAKSAVVYSIFYRYTLAQTAEILEVTDERVRQWVEEVYRIVLLQRKSV